jgi:hypothetical protein
VCDGCSTVQLFAGVEISEGVGHIAELLTHMVIRKSAMYYKYVYSERVQTLLHQQCYGEQLFVAVNNPAKNNWSVSAAPSTP